MKNYEIPLSPENYYHIYNHANGSDNLFLNSENYRYFLQRYATFINPIADTFAYCLMPNHIHFLIRIKAEPDLQKAYEYKKQSREKLLEEDISNYLSREFASLFSSYSQAFNRQNGRKGSLFNPNFKRKLVETDKYFTQLVYYIHANPVHHGFVKDLSAWNYSSYHAFLSRKQTNLQRDEVLNWFGNVDSFRTFHEGMPLTGKLDFD
ncbi:transposase IS200 family protein [Arcicella aurantiaca]|jgi:putative transposase|uniref:Transposase IS200 family protein n=1 Tax=Arcicella aurantiaca TaxID=591202 RepID=A0A316DIL7_9BACT|nr:transposase [Arcicella aurantiaca]PWK17458.1 transposase IS200 family protein [Arcicella aurantiaca]